MNAQVSSIQVIKRDGSKEPYYENKIIKVVSAAGLKDDEAKTLGSNITAWVKQQTSASFSSQQIRDKVVEELKKVNIYVSNFYVWYEQTKDKDGIQ